MSLLPLSSRPLSLLPTHLQGEGVPMKLSVAGNRMAEDFDLADTQDCMPSYTGIVLALQKPAIEAAALAQAWLDHRDGAE